MIETFLPEDFKLLFKLHGILWYVFMWLEMMVNSIQSFLIMMLAESTYYQMAPNLFSVVIIYPN